MKKEEIKQITLDTMTKVGKEVEFARRKYLVAPINIGDMYLIQSNNLIIPIFENKEVDDVVFSVNVSDPERAKILFYIIEKYVRYEDGKIPMTKELVEEHGWSIKDIKKFLEVWLQVSD